MLCVALTFCHDRLVLAFFPHHFDRFQKMFPRNYFPCDLIGLLTSQKSLRNDFNCHFLKVCKVQYILKLSQNARKVERLEKMWVFILSKLLLFGLRRTCQLFVDTITVSTLFLFINKSITIPITHSETYSGLYQASTTELFFRK